MTRLTVGHLPIPFNPPDQNESVKALAKSFTAINDYVTGVNVRCSRCGLSGRANSRLVGKGKGRTVLCADCRVAS